MKLKLQEPRSVAKRKGQLATRSSDERRGKRLLTFLLCVLLSSVFWLMLSLRQVYRMRITVPVSYDDLPSNVLYSESAPSEIVFVVEDRGVQLLQYNLQDFPPIRPRLNSKRQGGSRLVLSKKALTDEFQRQLSPETRVISANPSDISVPLYTLREKRVPVKLGFKPMLPRGYRLGAVVINPAYVHIYGSAQSIRRIDAAYVDSVDLSSYTDLVERRLPLKRIPGIRFGKGESEVDVSFDVEALTERTYELPIKAYGVPVGYELTPLPGVATVTLTIPKARYNQLKPEEIELCVIYPESSSSISDGQLPVQLRRAPDWIVGYKCNPAKVEFILNQLKHE
ncbi:MAG: YbbR-like domain-containing protein [Porphyromonas sp.]|nr:YbbR-like domain-containing protein [Porphyromonas sp.]